MEIHGHIQNGVVVLAGKRRLPEGTPVTIVPRGAPKVHAPKKRRRVVLPLVPSEHPGTLRLTATRVAELMEEDDLSTRR